MTKLLLAAAASMFLYKPLAVAKVINCNRNQDSISCLTCNCYHESRSEPYEGQVAVNKVVLSRAVSNIKEYPETVCANVYKKWQFSWTNDKLENNIKLNDNEISKMSKNSNHLQELLEKKATFHRLVEEKKPSKVYEKFRPTETESYIICQNSVKVANDEGANGLIYFYDPRIASPLWARTAKKCGKAGHHIFMVPAGNRCPESLGKNSTKQKSTRTQESNSIN